MVARDPRIIIIVQTFPESSAERQREREWDMS
jgi:hypothetical protein